MNSVSQNQNSTLQTSVEVIDTHFGQDDTEPQELYCICRRPHDDRFMICCDACDEW